MFWTSFHAWRASFRKPRNRKPIGRPPLALEWLEKRALPSLAPALLPALHMPRDPAAAAHPLALVDPSASTVAWENVYLPAAGDFTAPTTTPGTPQVFALNEGAHETRSVQEAGTPDAFHFTLDEHRSRNLTFHETSATADGTAAQTFAADQASTSTFTFHAEGTYAQGVFTFDVFSLQESAADSSTWHETYVSPSRNSDSTNRASSHSSLSETGSGTLAAFHIDSYSSSSGGASASDSHADGTTPAGSFVEDDHNTATWAYDESGSGTVGTWSSSSSSGYSSSYHFTPSDGTAPTDSSSSGGGSSSDSGTVTLGTAPAGGFSLPGAAAVQGVGIGTATATGFTSLEVSARDSSFQEAADAGVGGYTLTSGNSASSGSTEAGTYSGGSPGGSTDAGSYALDRGNTASNAYHESANFTAAGNGGTYASAAARSQHRAVQRSGAAHAVDAPTASADDSTYSEDKADAGHASASAGGTFTTAGGLTTRDGTATGASGGSTHDDTAAQGTFATTDPATGDSAAGTYSRSGHHADQVADQEQDAFDDAEVAGGGADDEDEGTDAFEETADDAVSSAATYRFHDVDPATGSTADGTATTGDVEADSRSEHAAGTFSDEKGSSGSHHADQGTDKVQQGGSKHTTLVEAYTVHAVDPTTGSTADGTVARSDTRDDHDAEDAAGAAAPAALDLPALLDWINRHCPRLAIAPPQSKRLACEDVGVGAMAALGTILGALDRLLLA